ncbi:MAG: glycosyltransferase [Sulfolobales archaeon]
MSIVFLTGFYPPPETANGVRIYYFVKELRRRGYSVTVIRMYPRIISSFVERGGYGETIINLRSSRYAGLIGRIADLADGVLSPQIDRILEIIKTQGPSLVIASVPPIEAAYLGYRISMNLGTPLAIDVRDLIEFYRGDGFIRTIYRSYSMKKIHKIYREADLVTTTTEAQKAVLQSIIGRRDIVTVHNGVDIELYTRIYNIVARHRKTEDIYEIVFLGDLSWRYHMLEEIIKGFSLAYRKSNGKRLKLKIIGDGPLREELEAIVKKLELQSAVSFKGYLDREVLIKELITSDLAITGRPMSMDLWNITSMRSTIYEYIGAGLPILAFGPKHSYIEKFIKYYSIGTYITSNDPVDVCEGIQSMIHRLGEFDKDKIRSIAKIYDRNRLSRIYADTIENLLARKH